MKKRDETTASVYGIRNCTFGYKCGQDWESLPDLRKSERGSKIKHCSECNKDVYEAKTDKELIENIKLDRCIAILNTNGVVDLGYIKPRLEIIEG